MIFRRCLIILIILFFNSLSLNAFDYINGNIKLNINEKTGNFSLYYLNNTSGYVPLFNADEPKASYMSVNLDGQVYKLGQSGAFSTNLNKDGEYPVINYESQNLKVSKSFTPVKTLSSGETNGVKITVTITNTGSETVSAGLKLLFDTYLGEEKNENHFITDKQSILKETLLNGTSDGLFWVSKNSNSSLMGSIADPSGGNAKAPDSVHFANWRRLYNAPWTLSYVSNRSMDNRPYSMQDSAVCYFYDPAQLEAGKSFVYSIILSTEDYTGYQSISYEKEDTPSFSEDITYTDNQIPDEPVINNNDDNLKNENLKSMLIIQETLNKFLAGEIYLDAQDLDEIERAINGLR